MSMRMARIWLVFFVLFAGILISAVSGVVAWVKLTETIGLPVKYISAEIENPVRAGEKALYSVTGKKRHFCRVGVISRWIVENGSGVRHEVAKFKGSNQVGNPAERNILAQASFPVLILSDIPPLKGLFHTEVEYHCWWRSYTVRLPPAPIVVTPAL